MEDLLNTMILMNFTKDNTLLEEFVSHLYLNGTIHIILSIIQFIDSKIFDFKGKENHHSYSYLNQNEVNNEISRQN